MQVFRCGLALTLAVLPASRPATAAAAVSVLVAAVASCLAGSIAVVPGSRGAVASGLTAADDAGTADSSRWRSASDASDSADIVNYLLWFSDWQYGEQWLKYRNAWSKNFDKRPHRRPVATRCGEWIRSPSNTCFLWSTWVSPPNGISIGSAVFAGFTDVLNRQTDQPRYSMCSNRPLSLAIVAMRPKNSWANKL